MRLKWLSALCVLTLGSILAGCSSEEKKDPATTDKPSESTAPKDDGPTKKPEGTVASTDAKGEEGMTADEKAERAKIKIEDTNIGEGQMCNKGDYVLMEYTGTLTNGAEFDSNTGGDKLPFSFTIGNQQVIKGWDLGIPGMKAGGERLLTIPPELGYGAQGAGEKIPGNSTLIFKVKLLDVVKPNETEMYDDKVLKEGTGTAVVKKGDTITVDYKGTYTNGKQFDSSYDRKEPFTFTVGNHEVIPGWDFGVVGMKVGEKRWLRLPPMVAYGMGEAEPMPGRPKLEGQTLLFEIELKKIGK